MWDDDYWGASEEDKSNHRMDSKSKHPFAVTCRKCGSNRVEITPYDNGDLGIECKVCGSYLNCGTYHSDEYDYSL